MRKVIVKKTSKGSERGSHTFFWGNSIPGRWKRMCEGPQASAKLISGNSYKKRTFEVGWTRKVRVARHEIR